MKVLPREWSVYINCPYDASYQRISDALVFTIICCGFLPRSAVENGSSSVPRIERIASTMLGSKYAIHDLCRCKGYGTENFSRFNMPFELGFSAAQRYRSDDYRDHDWLALVLKRSAYVRFVSDLSGFDPYQYQGSVQTVVPAVMSWLAVRPNAPSFLPTPTDVLQALPAFLQEKADLAQKWKGHAPWASVIRLGIQVAIRFGMAKDRLESTARSENPREEADLTEAVQSRIK